MLNPSDYRVASPQEVLKDISQGWQAKNLHSQVSANLIIPVSRYLGLAYKARYVGNALFCQSLISLEFSEIPSLCSCKKIWPLRDLDLD